MKAKMNALRGAAATIIVAATLSACGGGDSGTVPADSGGIPSSALQSTDGLLSFARDLLANLIDTAEPISLGSAALPTNDTAEPFALN